MGITGPNKLKDKEQELSQKLRDTQTELNNKEDELKKALNENKEKSTVIEEYQNTIKALQENVEDYKKQIASINAELATLRDKTQNNGENISNEPTTKQQTNEAVSEQPDIKLDSYELYNKTLSQLILEIDGCIETAKYKRGLNKSGKETLKTAQAKLKQYKDIISDKKRMLEHEFKEKNKLNEKNPDKVPLEVTISNAEIQELKRRRSDRRKNIEDDIKEGQNGKSSNIAPWPNQSLEQVIKGNRVDTHHIEYDSKLNEALNDAAFLRIIDNKQDKAREFLQAIANNSLSDAQITICQTRMVQLAPYFEKYGMTEQVNRCIIQSHGGRIEAVQGFPRSSVDYSNMDFGEAFQQGGIVGLIDKGLSSCKNMTPGQRNTWKSIAVLGGYAAGIYGLFKFFTNKNMGFWGKALTTGGVILGSQMLTGENPITLFQRLLTGGFTKEYLEDKFGNAFGDAVDGVQNSGIENGTNLSGAMYSLMIFNETATVGEVRGRSTKFKNDPQSWRQFCGVAKEKIGAKHFEKFSAVFSENFDEDKWNERLNSIGIHEGIDNNKLIYELASYKTMNTIAINKFLSDNGIKVTEDKTQKAEYEQYIQSCNNNNKTVDIKTLETHMENGSRFKEDLEATYTDRKIDGENIKQLEAQVEALPIDSQNKDKLKIAIKRFYDERTIESKPNPDKFNLKMNGNFLILTSHGGYETKINLKNRSLEGFGSGDGITFTNLSDLLNAADLTNKILESQKGKIAAGNPPFQCKSYIPDITKPNITKGIGLGGKGIYFNSAKGVRDDLISFNWSGTDTRVLSSGLWGASNKIKEIDIHLEDYAEYLSNRREEVNNISI